MRHTLYLIVLCLGLVEAQAQKLSKRYIDTSLSDVLIDLNRSQTDNRVSFIYNELEDFTVTTSFRNQTIGNAVRQVVGFYPMKITETDSLITVECIQKETQKVIGRVINEQGQPVEFANVALLLPADSSFINGGVTNANGDFVIPSRPGHMLIRVSFVGYKTHYQPCTVGEVGNIRLRRDAIVLKNVVVKGDIPQYKATTGGMTVEIQNSILKDVGTADDLLSMLPRVEGSDGKFTVFAKGEPEIYINNKKVRDAKELKQLKSTNIKSVDIITSPGARYNAEVNAVIRIKTIKRQDNGLSVAAYTQTKYNNWWTNYEDLTIRYRTGGLEIFGTGTFNNHHYSEDPVLSSEFLFDNNPIHIDQIAPNSIWFTSVQGKAGLSYDFDENNSIGMTYGCFGELYGGGEMNGSQTIYRNGQLEGNVRQWMRVDHRTMPDHDANIYYVGKIGKLGIDFNGTWLWQKTVRRDVETERSTELENRDIHTNAEDRNRMLAAKLVLSYPVWKGELSVGSETTNTHSNGMSENIEGWVPTSENHIKENNLAGFAEYEVQLGQWSLDAGLRYEHVSTEYESYSIRSDIQPEPSRTYNDLFPNISVGWQKDKWGLQLSYTKRINRPSYHSLSNYLQYDNRYQVEGGNPMLRPAIRQDIDFSAIYSWLSFNAGFEHYSDKILNFSSLYQQGGDIIMWRNENFDDFNCCHASIVASPKWGIYTPTLTLGYFQQFFDVKQYGIDHSLTKPEWSINLRNWLKLGKTAKAMVYIHYATTHDYGFSRQYYEFNVNARLQKTFMKRQLTAVLFANDIFGTLRDKWNGYYPVEVLSRDACQYSREIGISLQYNFNATRPKYKGTGAGNAEKSRL